MQEVPSVQVAVNKLKDTRVIKTAESFLERNYNTSKLNGNRNEIVREAIDILINIEDSIKEHGNNLDESDLERINQILADFERFQILGADITRYIISTTEAVVVCKKRIETKKTLDSVDKWTPKNLLNLVSVVKVVMDQISLDEETILDISRLLQLVSSFIKDNNLMELDWNQKDNMKQILLFIEDLIESHEFHKLSTTKTGVKLKIEESVFRIKMDLLMKGDWNYIMH